MQSKPFLLTVLSFRRCIRTPYRADRSELSPWDPASRFMGLLLQLHEWHAHLPEHLVLSDMNVYIHKEQKNLAAFLSMFVLYHVSVSDLTRITLAGYNFPLAAAFAHAPLDFLERQQAECLRSAEALTSVFEIGFSHDIESAADMISAAAAFESTKVQVIHLTTIGKGVTTPVARVKHKINSNLRILAALHGHSDSASVFVSSESKRHL